MLDGQVLGLAAKAPAQVRTPSRTGKVCTVVERKRRSQTKLIQMPFSRVGWATDKCFHPKTNLLWVRVAMACSHCKTLFSLVWCMLGLVNNTALRFLDLSNCDLTGKDSTFIRMLLMSSKSLISVKLEGNGLRVERDSAHVHAVIHKATASTMTPHQRRVQSAMRRKKQRHSLDESSHDDTIANLDHAFESPDVETRFVCRHDPELPHSRQNPATTPSGTPSSSPAGSQASTPSGSPIGSPSISPSISPLGSPRAESAVLTTSAANAAELEKKRQARLQRQIAREHGMWQKQSPFQMRQWIPTNVCWYTAFVQHSNESKERKTSRTQPRSSQNSPPQRTSAKFLGSVSENVSPVQNSALADSAAQPVMVPVKFVYVPRILGPDFVEKLELLVWSDDKRWCDKAGNPWSNHCLFKRGGHHENGGAMTYHDRCVMDKVHRILLACSKLQWRFRRTALIRKYTRSGGDIFEAYRAFLTKQLNGGENREPPFFTACACPETALVTQRYDKPTAPTVRMGINIRKLAHSLVFITVACVGLRGNRADDRRSRQTL